MKTLFIECNMGAAGDMLMSALSEICPNSSRFIERLNNIGIPGIKVEKHSSVKCGITGTHIKVFVDGIEETEEIHEHNHKNNHVHSHMGIYEIENIINNLNVSDSIKKSAISVYKLIAEAESKAHGREVEHIHFHEVGTMDAVCDIVGFCMLIEEIGAEEIIVSSINVGKGQVKCAHGTLPVPAPATAYILKNVPIYSNEINGELCTPTGAALLKYFAKKFSNMPLMKIQKIGYGMGTKDFETVNCVRAILGETEDKNIDTVTELCFNIDDMTGEQIGYALGEITEAGALDIFTTAINMKKNRPAVMITCLCRETEKDNILNAIFKHTSTIGVRENICKRYILKKEKTELKTNYGKINAKKSTGYGTEKIKAEYEDLAKIAKKNNISIMDIKIESDIDD